MFYATYDQCCTYFYSAITDCYQLTHAMTHVFGKRCCHYKEKTGSLFIHDIRKWITRRSILFTVSVAIARVTRSRYRWRHLHCTIAIYVDSEMRKRLDLHLIVQYTTQFTNYRRKLCYHRPLCKCRRFRSGMIARESRRVQT